MIGTLRPWLVSDILITQVPYRGRKPLSFSFLALRSFRFQVSVLHTRTEYDCRLYVVLLES
jgi:hypothetical protein